MRTSSGATFDDDLARFEAVDAVADREDQRQVVLDDDERRVELLLHAQDQRAERFGFALRDAGGRLVETDHAGRDREHARELDDAPGAGRELGDVAVGVAAEPEEVDELRRFGVLGPLAVGSTATTRATTQNDVRCRASSASSHRLADGELGEQDRALERAAEPERGPLVRALAADLVAEELAPSRGSARSRRSR